MRKFQSALCFLKNMPFENKEQQDVEGLLLYFGFLPLVDANHLEVKFFLTPYFRRSDLYWTNHCTVFSYKLPFMGAVTCTSNFTRSKVHPELSLGWYKVHEGGRRMQ